MLSSRYGRRGRHQGHEHERRAGEAYGGAEGVPGGRLCDADRALADAPRLPQDFAKMVRDLEGQKLDGWIQEAEVCNAPALRNFAAGLKKDLDERGRMIRAWARKHGKGSYHPNIVGGPELTYGEDE